MYPEKILQVIYDYQEGDLKKLLGKDLIFYDEHHGLAWRLNNAKTRDIKRLLSHTPEYTVIILL